MTLKQFLETYCDDGLQVEISDSWYVGEESFCVNGFVKDILQGGYSCLDMKLKSIDNDMYQLLILVEK